MNKAPETIFLNFFGLTAASGISMHKYPTTKFFHFFVILLQTYKCYFFCVLILEQPTYHQS